MTRRRYAALLLATLAIPLPHALATAYLYTTPVDLAATPYAAADTINLQNTTASASSPTTISILQFRFTGQNTVSLDHDLTITGPLAGSGTNGFSKLGPATLTVTGNSPNFIGDVTVGAPFGTTPTPNAGVLRLGSASALGMSTATHGPGRLFLNPGGTLDLNGFVTDRVLNLAGGAVVNDNTSTPVDLPAQPALTGTYVFGGAGDITFNSQLFSSGPFTKIGPGTVTLTNPANNSNYFGHFTVNGGTLRFANAGAMGNPHNNVYLNPTGTVDLNGLSPVRKYYYFQGGTLANNDTTTPVTLDGNNFYAYGPNAPGGTIIFGGAGDITLDTYLSSSYSATFVKTGAGTVTLATNAFLGTTGAQVQAGTLRLGADNRLPVNGTTTLLPGGSLDVNGFTSPAGPVTLAGGAYVNNNLTTPVTVNPSSYLVLTGPDLRFGGAGDMTLNVSPTGSQSLTKVGAGTLTLNAVPSHTGGTNLLAATTLLANDTLLGPINTPLNLVDGTLRNTNPFQINHPVTVSGSLGGFDTSFPLVVGRPITGTGALNKSGTSTLAIPHTLAIGPLAVHQGTLILSTSARAVVSELSITPGAFLNMDRPRFFIDPASDDTPLPLDAVRSLLLSARNGGDWLGSGLTAASLFPANNPGTRALAYADASLLPPSYRQVGPTTFVDEHSVYIRPTYYGDANCDGTLDASDFVLLDRSYALALSNPHWTDGDFNYDGIINNQDYLLLDAGYLSLNPAASTTLLAQRQSQFGPDYAAALSAAIPEPSLLLSSILCPLSSLFIRRRR